MEKNLSAPLERPHIVEISAEELEGRLRQFEERYGMRSEEFHRQAQAGLLDEQDEYIAWLGYYEAHLRLCRRGAACASALSIPASYHQ